MVNKPRILLFDIETAPNLGYCWGKWEQNIIDFKEHWYMLSFAYKWLGESKTHVASLPGYSLYKKDKTNDKELTKTLWNLFDEADIIIAHNGDSFDIKKSNALFIKHELTPPTPYKTIDTKLVAKRYFRFDSNKLDDLGDYLKLGRKLQTGGFDLWLGCIANDKKSWKTMCDYNKQDVILLEQVYEKLKPWMTNHPNLALIQGDIHGCPNCGSDDLQKRGLAYTRTSISQRYQCNHCHSWSSTPKEGRQVR